MVTGLMLTVALAAGSEAEMWDEAKRAATAFTGRTGVAIEWMNGDPATPQPLGGGVVVWAPIALDLDASLPALVAELTVYPDGFLKSAGLKRIVLTRGLERGGRAWGGLAFSSGPQKGTLYVSLRNVMHSAVTIHHEVFHLAQHTRRVLERERDWRACNPGNFRYYAEGDVDRSAPRVATITDYARTSLVEDQAEVFAWLIADASFVDTHAERDAAIACKAKLVKDFARAVDGAFDESRWKRLRERRPGERF
jgi:hypothetical protein